MHLASLEIQKKLNIPVDEIIGKPDFKDVWEAIWENDIAVLAIENSYMGSIHPNLHGFLKYDCKIIGRYDMLIQHCLCSKEKRLEDITKAYSQLPALDQCYTYLKDNDIEPMVYSDTSLAAKHVSETEDRGKAAICSEFAAKLNHLNILDTNIQDNDQNTTRFAVITHKAQNISYSSQEWKMSLIFEVKHIPGALSDTLDVFRSHKINLSKIESMPSFHKTSFLFWINIEWYLQQQHVNSAIKKLQEICESVQIIGEY